MSTIAPSPIHDHDASRPPGGRERRPVPPAAELDPALEALVRQIIGRVADKWTMLALEVLAEQGRQRFTRLGELIGGISQKMLTKTLRQMEADGLVTRTVLPVIPPHVEYELTDLGLSLGEAFCGVWIWAEQNRAAIEAARSAFEARRS
ncbi:helix-turn-helix transcriptional regulator [Mesorhizobium sp. BR1-1-16]|uniref:winged helix-turn-helix transcriptional regulator n=1 Tax=Mesorhizobium sp. BR1-1-16 TaxID=2876653 RepID=UPI001CCFA0DF|nr:helix-turn-helix domain-containing protein [Mesorhizobium sp. BR1-1-16]MBZ9937988.1 helix-turn-helix transcriptional regulator [Mesorhizobium sp. BR1-1-16]